MKSCTNNRVGVVAFILACAFWAGCASSSMTNWDQRVGTFTYEQAVAELGKPASVDRLADGSFVDEWLTQRDENRVTLGVGTGMAAAGSGAGIAQPLGMQPHDQYIRLTFGRDGKLVSWRWDNH